MSTGKRQVPDVGEGRRLRVLLIHWNEGELPERAAPLERLGYHVEGFADQRGGDKLKRFTAHSPDAFVIDLSRLPSHGRAVGVYFREHKPTRHVPLIFVDGDPEKVARVRELLPDATYASWSTAGSALKKAIAKRPQALVVPRTMDAYSGTPLPKKLGIKPNIAVLLLGAPDDFESLLAVPGAGAAVDPGRPIIRRRGRSPAELVMLFVRSRAELRRKLPAARRAMADGGSMWIAWPKKASAIKTDVSETEVRAAGLAGGLVDFKICAIDNTWSGLRFSRRQAGSKRS